MDTVFIRLATEADKFKKQCILKKERIMKRALSIAASVLMFAGVSFAATSSQTGTISDIVIGSSFSLSLASWTSTSDGTTDTVVPNSNRTNGNLVFTSMNMTSAGIVATSTATGASAYKATPHRANAYFNTVQFWIANNVYPALRVDVTGSGTLFTGLTAPLAGQSVMHVTPGTATYTPVGSTTSKTTTNTGFIVNSGTPRSVTGTATTLWHDTTTAIEGDDVFAAVFALDFMPITIPNGTYSGSIQYDLISE